MAKVKTLGVSDYPVETAVLFKPSLEDISTVLNERLQKHFKTVKVEVVDCPDLTQQPFTLACKGLGGTPSVVELGGVPYLLPTPKLEKLYDIRDVATVVGINPAYITGAGAGPWPYAGVNCEMIANLEVRDGKVRNETRIAKVGDMNKQCIQQILPDDESRTAVLANLYASEGKPGKVLKVHCKTRIAPQDFITSVRTSLQDHYGKQPVGLGGVFLMSEGKVKQHIMNDFSKTPINSEEELNQWLEFYEMSTPLVALGTLVSSDPGLDLRVQHFHSFSHHGEGGHYHYDTTPDTIEYLAYFNVADKIYRIDRPVETHQMGRD